MQGFAYPSGIPSDESGTVAAGMKLVQLVKTTLKELGPTLMIYDAAIAGRNRYFFPQIYNAPRQFR
jgi:hypothetical protein